MVIRLGIESITGENIMDVSKEVKMLREKMGMNRREFCDYYGIPYRTMVDWEAGKRKMPDYLLRLLEYKAIMESMLVENYDDSK